MMILRKLRKDGAIWDVALVAILMNLFLQIGCCTASDELALGDPSLWCSIDKSAAAATAQADTAGEHHAKDCTDCRHCTGQSVAIAPNATPLALPLDHAVAVAIGPDIHPSISVTPGVYDGRAPPATLQI